MLRIEVGATREERKEDRTRQVKKITATVMRGNKALVFDGDETSQLRMLLVAARMRATNTPVTTWRLADNSDREVTADELEAALDLSLLEMQKLWFV